MPRPNMMASGLPDIRWQLIGASFVEKTTQFEKLGRGELEVSS